MIEIKTAAILILALITVTWLIARHYYISNRDELFEKELRLQVEKDFQSQVNVIRNQANKDIHVYIQQRNKLEKEIGSLKARVDEMECLKVILENDDLRIRLLTALHKLKEIIEECDGTDTYKTLQAVEVQTVIVYIMEAMRYETPSSLRTSGVIQ